MTGLFWHWGVMSGWETRKQRRISRRSSCQRRMLTHSSRNCSFKIELWMCLFCSYVMSNGYKPAPLDLSHVKLTPNQNQLVEKLAENGHNVWARDRVRQGWTYSIVQVTAPHTPSQCLFVYLTCCFASSSVLYEDTFC